MSLHNRVSRRSFTALICLSASLVLTGCFRPMLAERSNGSSVSSDLSQIYIEVMNTRVGQVIRNDLIFDFGGNSASGSAFQLSISIDVTKTSALVQPNTRARGKTISITAVYTLTDTISGEVVHGGTAFSRASYDSSAALFANERAELDAENRAAGVLANDISIRISAWFAANPSPRSSS